MWTKHNSPIDADAIKALAQKAGWVLRIHRERGTLRRLEVYECGFGNEAAGRSLQKRGAIGGKALGVCFPMILDTVSAVTDDLGVPVGIERCLSPKSGFQGDAPLDETAGGKLGLLFLLQTGIRTPARMALLARRIDRFTGEEAKYWLGKITLPIDGAASCGWAKAGMRQILCGTEGDEAGVEQALAVLRTNTGASSISCIMGR